MKIHTATVSSKGQIVLPRAIRDRLGIGMGDQIEFVSDERGVHLRPKPDVPSGLDAWLGAAPTEGKGTAELATIRHSGMSTDEQQLMRDGPGANVTHLDLTALLGG